jgi:hypothetical protein
MLRRAFWLSLALLGACTLRCGSKVGEEAVVSSVRRLGEEVDTVKDVSCPKLAAEVAATTTCSVTFADGSAHPVLVKVESVDDNGARFNAMWRTALLGKNNRAALQASMREALGQPVDLLCPDGLIELPTDKHLTCQLRAPTSEGPVDIWYSAEGKLVWETPGGTQTPAATTP